MTLELTSAEKILFEMMVNNELDKTANSLNLFKQTGNEAGVNQYRQRLITLSHIKKKLD